MKVCKKMCGTCPFKDGSVHENLRPYLTEASLKDGRICHSTGGPNAIHSRGTGKPAMICRGSRDFQLEFFKAIGFLDEATDEAWNQKCKELGIKPDTKRKHERQRKQSA